MSKKLDLTGQRFGKLTALYALPERDKWGKVMWNCRCDCGKTVTVSEGRLKRGNKKSCGCLKVGHNKTHGKSDTRLYYVWHTMKQRCNNPKHNRYHLYGARGIKVCPEWERDFAAFEEWAMKNGYNENAPRGQCTIDRIDVNGFYCPDNCRWVDMKVQNNNQRKSNKKQ